MLKNITFIEDAIMLLARKDPMRIFFYIWFDFSIAEGKKLLLHECWTIMNEHNGNHSSYEEINDILTKYKIERLGFIHIDPNWKADTFKELSSFTQQYLNVVIVEDDMIFEL